MMVVGSTVLHELFHCWAIFWQVEHYDEYIYDAAHYGKTSYWWHKIIDNPDGVPGCKFAPKGFVSCDCFTIHHSHVLQRNSS